MLPARILALGAVLAALGGEFARADLPVHCLGDEFLGSWHIKMTLPSANDMHAGATVCGHERPDDFTTSMRTNDRFEAWWYDRLSPSEQQTTSVAPYTLCVPHANGTDARLCEGAISSCGSAPDSGEHCQNIDFTMLYDEGFIVSAKLDEVAVKFVGFFRYQPIKPVESDSAYPPLGSLFAYKSLCGETITGVYSARGDALEKDGKFYNGCFVAKKATAVAEHSSEMRRKHQHRRAETAVVSPNAGLLQLQEDDTGGMRARARVRARSAQRARNAFEDFLDTDVVISNEFVDQVNALDLGWSASSESAASFTQNSYRAALQRMGITSPDMLETYERDFDLMRSGHKLASSVHHQDADEAREIMDQKDRTTLEADVVSNSLEYVVAETKTEVTEDARRMDCAMKHLPARFDWTDEELTRCPGVVDPASDQGSCGSCYSVSAAGAATARLRIAQHPSKACRTAAQGSEDVLHTKLSAQSVLDCSYVNQGCDGGYPMLAAFYGFAEGWTNTTCDPYRAESKTCQVGKDCKRWYAHDFSYVGNQYGYKADMTSMMVDLIMHGPVGIAIDAPAELQVYENGVFTPLWDAQSDTLKGRHSYWQKTNHAVLAVGYDVLESDGRKVPVWRIQNSWGEKWGDHGFFYLPRGKDLISSETMPVSIRFAEIASSKVGKDILQAYYQCLQAGS